MERVELTGEKTQYTVGDSFRLTPVFTPQDATDQTGAWTVSNARLLQNNGDGSFQALAAGRVVVTFTATDGGRRAQYVITIRENTVPAQGVSLNAGAFSSWVDSGGIRTYLMNTGTIRTISATVSPVGASQSVTYISSNPAVATVARMDGLRESQLGSSHYRAHGKRTDRFHPGAGPKSGAASAVESSFSHSFPAGKQFFPRIIFCNVNLRLAFPWQI